MMIPAPLSFATSTVAEGSVPSGSYQPVRSIADIEACERVPLEQRIGRWDFALNLLDGCHNDPRKPALHAAHNGDLAGGIVTWTFAELERHATGIANLLHASGVRAEDAVAIITPTVPALYASLIGGLLAARPFPINWMLDPGAIRDLVSLSGARVAIALGPTPGFTVWENVTAALAGLPNPVELFSLHDPFGPAHPRDLLTEAAGCRLDRLDFPRATAVARTVALYVHSGGTTGDPKIVRITHGGLVYRQWGSNFGLGFTTYDVTLSDTPLFHIGGMCVRGLVPTANGMTSVIPSMHGARDKTYIANYWRFVERFGITQISGVPTTLSVLAKSPPASEDISSLRPYFMTGSTAIAPAVQERLGAITGARTLMSYGLTENTSNASVDPRDGSAKRGCSGLRVPYTIIRIAKMGRDGVVQRECGLNEIGMVLVGGPGIAAGYLDPAQDRGAFLPDGFFVTGDLGSLDEDGFVRITGREKDVIIRGGHNIEPGMIEDALLQSPWVAQAAAVGKPDAHAGELPVAYVELHPGAVVSVEELLRYAAERTPERAAVPKEITIVDRLPLTAVGKPLKHLLRADAAKRVFNAALQPVPGPWALEISSIGGLSLIVVLSGAVPGARERATDILSTFSTPFRIVQEPP